MNESSKHEFGHKALASAVATALVPGMAHAAAGRVDFAYGDVKGVNTAGQERRLSKGSQIEQGDTILTARGRAQIRFSDGARTSLLPNSEFRVDAYEYEEQKQEESKGFSSLLKGGLRTITGAIGKLRQSAYQVTTPSATIGIRGTEYLVVLGNSANLWVGDGSIEACNEGGCQTFEGGESGYVADNKTKPIHTDTKPDTTGGDVGNDPYSSSEDVDEDGVSDIFAGFANGAFYTLAVSIGDVPEGGAIDQAGVPPADLINATFDGNRLTSYSGPLNGTVGTASVVESDGDGIIGWGRWTEGVIATDVYGGTVPVDLTGSESHHYAIGLPTTDMPLTGTGTYALLGGTSPTYADGSGTGTLNSASLNVDFGDSTVQVLMNLSIGGSTFDINSGSDVEIGSGSHMFGGSGSYASSSACSGPCSTQIEGFFAGSGASRVALVYKIYDDSASSYVNGAAGFTKSGP